ncbi:MAG TPA: hypothetical protein VF345_06495 [Chthoniobacterales bacterium]
MRSEMQNAWRVDIPKRGLRRVWADVSLQLPTCLLRTHFQVAASFWVPGKLGNEIPWKSCISIERSTIPFVISSADLPASRFAAKSGLAKTRIVIGSLAGDFTSFNKSRPLATYRMLYF